MLLSKEASHNGLGAAPGGLDVNGYAINLQQSRPVRGDIVSDSSSESIPTHPLGVKPLGNQYLFSGITARANLGFIACLPDEMLVQLLEYLDSRSLRNLGYSCKYLHAFSHSDDLWKALFLESHSKNKRRFSWNGTWRRSLLELSSSEEAQIDCSNVFSDVLHRPFVCSHISLSHYGASIPHANQISRLKNMSYETFAEHWSDTPFILTECIQSWPAYQTWSIDTLQKMYPNVEFRAEAVDWPFSIYHDYMVGNNDESPLYLFDKKFAEKMRIKIGEGPDTTYKSPQCFGPDLFELLGKERPAHRWLIIGPQRSGSTFHKDPNATSAWNAVLQGSKYWIMFPPNVSVPGVFVSDDSSEVTSPLSIAEWLLEFHAEARSQAGCIEGVCKTGEILHVPSGWWHLVVNLEAGVALTQNFVPKSHLTEVLSFLKRKPDQVTGFQREILDPYQLFVERLQAQYPDLIETALLEVERKQGGKKRTWDDVVGSDHATQENDSGGFSFGFGDLDDDDIP